MPTSLRLLALTCCISLLTACDPKSAGGNSSPVVQAYVVKGDPALILAGAAMEPESPYTVDTIQDLNEFSLVSLLSFSEREKPKSEKNVDLEKENAANDGNERKTSFPLTVTRENESSYKAQIADLNLSLLFSKEANGKLQIKSVISGSASAELTVLHWSRTPDHNFVSVLLRTEDPDQGKQIVAVYFERNASEMKIPLLNSQFKYLAGPGVGLSWNQQDPLQLEVCGAEAEVQKMKDAVARWQKPLAGRLDITVSSKARFAPFSDLNEQCVYFINTYISDVRSDVANYGLTLPLLSRGRGRIVDSDILIFRAEFEKFRSWIQAAGYSPEQIQANLDGKMATTLTHEFGHMLGLDHQFDGTPSIMSYKLDSPALTSYDVQAIQALYPLRN